PNRAATVLRPSAAVMASAAGYTSVLAREKIGVPEAIKARSVSLTARGNWPFTSRMVGSTCCGVAADCGAVPGAVAAAAAPGVGPLVAVPATGAPPAALP